mgnify:CR=1 FL=1
MNGKEFIKAVKLVTEEKGICEDVIFEGMEQALITAYKKNFKKQTNVKVDIKLIDSFFNDNKSSLNPFLENRYIS